MKKILVFLAAVILAILLAACGKPSPTEEFAAQTGIDIQGLTAYTGAYYEDGSDDAVENVMQIKLKNTGEKDYQLVYIKLTDKSGNEYSFKLTSLRPGDSMVALEENRAEYDSGMKIAAVRAEDDAYFSSDVSMHSDTLSIASQGNSVMLYNLTDKPLSNIHAFYKNYDGDTAVGGITYTISVPALAAGESLTLSTGHFDENTSRFIFVSYDEEN